MGGTSSNITRSSRRGRGERDGNEGLRNVNINRRKNKHDSLTHLTIDAQSLQYKMNELRELAFQHKPQIIAVTETGGNSNIDDINFKIRDYVMYRTDRLNDRTFDAGGTLLYIHDKLGQRECKPLNRPLNGIPFDSSTWCWVTPVI